MGGLNLGFERLKRCGAAGCDDQIPAFFGVILGKFAANAGGCTSDKGCVGHKKTPAAFALDNTVGPS